MKLSPTLLSLATIVGGLLLPIGVLLPLFMADFMYAFLVFTLGAVLFAKVSPRGVCIASSCLEQPSCWLRAF